MHPIIFEVVFCLLKSACFYKRKNPVDALIATDNVITDG